MPIGLKLEGNILYHGTSFGRAEAISNIGFKKSVHRYDRWLGSDGIYFVSNRPLIALRFAEICANEEATGPAVLAVSLSDFDDESILDLTSDIGLNNLYRGYSRLERIFKQTKHASHPRTTDTYFVDLTSKLDSIDGVAKGILALNISEKNSFNWDSAALRLVAMECNCQIIVAAIHEGTTFNLSFSGENYHHRISRNYKGLKFRDHIEVCIIEPSIISKESIEFINKDDITNGLENTFVNTILDYRTPDAE